MANYATHIAVGTVASGALATLTLAANVIDHSSLIAVTLAGVAGSVLPDIDLKDSRASRILFSGIAIFASFCVLFIGATRYSIAELWILWLGALIFVRYGVHNVFHYFAIHRGVWHSILAGVFWGFVTAILYRYMLGFHEGVAWLGAGFMLAGYIVHLVLDEMFSVDFMGNRLKNSFGTALKIVDKRYPAQSTALAVATLMIAFLTPSTSAFVEHITSRDMWSGLHERMLPHDKWFGLIKGPLLLTSAGYEGTSDAPPSTKDSLVTGSVMPAGADTPSRQAPNAETE